MNHRVGCAFCGHSLIFSSSEPELGKVRGGRKTTSGQKQICHQSQTNSKDYCYKRTRLVSQPEVNNIQRHKQSQQESTRHLENLRLLNSPCILLECLV